ncbi:MAG: TolB-like 6-bladed beta-propeller domain-containing protein [Muribaculaceae bacterium]|nr:TolB-like 6-bladed beta-propeller domain-containing protein [Muribaculaceae bacterium]
MKSFFYFSAAVVAAASLIACQSKVVENTETIRHFTLDDFETVNLNVDNAEPVSDDDMILGYPKQIEMLDDNIMAIHDANNDKSIWFLNTTDGRYSNCMTKGEGPLESLGISNTYINDGKLYVAPARDKKFFEISVDRNSLEPTIKHVASGLDDMYKSMLLADDEVVYAPFFADSVRFLRAMLDGVATDTIGNFYFMTGDDEFVPRNNLAQMNVAISADRNSLVAANLEWNAIEIYDLAHNNETMLLGPIDIDTKVVKRELPIGITYTKKPRWEMFLNPAISAEGFTVGYNGIKIESSDDLGKGFSNILSFTLDGQPTKRLVLSESINCYTIDPETMILYFVSNGEDPVIKKIALPISYKELVTPTH